MNQNIFYIVQGIMLVFVTICTVILIHNNKKLKEYKDMYDKALSKFNNSDIPKAEFNLIYERLNKVEDDALNLEKQIEIVKEENLQDIKKIGFVKYNAYDDGDNKLSFALAFTDSNLNGIMLNKIYSKHGSNLYAKKIKNGIIEERISEEEDLALLQIRTGQKIEPQKEKQLSKGKKDGKTKKH